MIVFTVIFSPHRIWSKPSLKAQRPLQVASWPAPCFGDNRVIRLLCDGISNAGAEIIDVGDPCDIRPEAVDIFQIHWPEQLFWGGLGPRAVAMKSKRIVTAIKQLKHRGVRVVWMVHNLRPHEMTIWQSVVWSYYQRQLCRLADGFLTLSPSTVSLVRAAFPRMARIPGQFVWHPAYTDVTVADSIREQARAALQFDRSTHVFACIGEIRPHKGIDQLVRAFRRLPNQDVGLLVAGAPLDGEIRRIILAEAGSDPRIRLDFRRLEESEFRAYTAASDGIVVPFRRYLHSGSLVYALSGQRTVLTPDAPYARDLSTELGPEWVHLYTPPLTPEIMARVDRARPLMPCPIQERLSYVEGGAAMVRFYRSLG